LRLPKKSKTSQHLILFDDTCRLCWRSIHRIHAWDKKKVFRFVPIRDPYAKKVLQNRWEKLKNADTLILIENNALSEPKIWIRGKAVFRVLWLLGGWKKIIGALAFLPWGVDALYAIIAKRRHRF